MAARYKGTILVLYFTHLPRNSSLMYDQRKLHKLRNLSKRLIDFEPYIIHESHNVYGVNSFENRLKFASSSPSTENVKQNILKKVLHFFSFRFQWENYDKFEFYLIIWKRRNRMYFIAIEFLLSIQSICRSLKNSRKNADNPWT